MSNCQVTTGFLVLRECGEVSVDSCRICGKAICMTHKRSHPQSLEVCCIDCYAKAKDTTSNNVNIDGKNDENHCSICGIEVFSKVGSKNPQNKVLDPDTKQVVCQGCYDSEGNANNKKPLRGASLLSSALFDDDYWYGYRSRFYRHRHYRPLFRGRGLGIFGEDEIRIFNAKNNLEENQLLNDDNDDNVFDS